jgi:hypothetical protein
VKKSLKWKPIKATIVAKDDKTFKCVVHAKRCRHLCVHPQVDERTLMARKTKSYDTKAEYFSITHVHTGYRMVGQYINESSAKNLVEILEERCQDALAFKQVRGFNKSRQHIFLQALAKAVVEDGVLGVKSDVKERLKRILEASRRSS